VIRSPLHCRTNQT